MKKIPGSILAPSGFYANGVFCDVKEIGTGKGSEKGAKRDLAVLHTPHLSQVAATFTTNQVKAAPVRLCLSRYKRSPEGLAIVMNSGNANACTGQPGMEDAKAMSQALATRLKVPNSKVYVASTGRIGVRLPMAKVLNGIELACADLGHSEEHANRVAEAIMTSDSRPKQAGFELRLGGTTVRLGGIAKGAGMIQPGMSPNGQLPACRPLHATMLCFITSDVAVDPEVWQKCLHQAVAQSFNRISVDGDMSTNDTVLAFANGAAGNTRINSSHKKEISLLQNALNELTLDLAKMIVADGEGVSKIVTLKLTGARSFEDADAAVRAVANSSLVKTSWNGGDPNWGRIMDALGYSAARIKEEKVDIGYSLPGGPKKSILWIVKGGGPTSVSLAEAHQVTKAPEFEIHIALNLGKVSTEFYTCDLSEEYVDFNKGE